MLSKFQKVLRRITRRVGVNYKVGTNRQEKGKDNGKKKNNKYIL